MKKQILEALKAKFQGVSEAILNRIADKLAKTVTTAEQVATAVEGVTIQQVIESYGDSRATQHPFNEQPIAHGGIIDEHMCESMMPKDPHIFGNRG